MSRLNEAQRELFFAMEKRDQRHALEVARRLRTGGVSDADVLVAALLHDCGKGGVPVWLRVLKVVSPSITERAALEGGENWRGAAFRLVHHAAIGAALAEAAGSSSTTVRLIHGQPAADEAQRLALLEAADNAS
jgi:hypothetical protein